MNRLTFWASCVLVAILGLIVPPAAPAQLASDGLQAGQDAYQRAEAERRAAIDHQRQLVWQMQRQYAWGDPRYAPSAADAYGYAYGPRRTYRQALRLGYVPLWPRAPGDIYGDPYHGFLRQPTGNGRDGTAPNGYVYRPGNVPPPPAPGGNRSATPTPAAPRPSGSPETNPSLSAPVPEAIPAPPSEPGPREF
jgi:hypothetical protein